jgi:hypothetical protein
LRISSSVISELAAVVATEAWAPDSTAVLADAVTVAFVLSCAAANPVNEIATAKASDVDFMFISFS